MQVVWRTGDIYKGALLQVQGKIGTCTYTHKREKAPGKDAERQTAREKVPEKIGRRGEKKNKKGSPTRRKDEVSATGLTSAEARRLFVSFTFFDLIGSGTPIG